jgi:hypothetical protein
VQLQCCANGPLHLQRRGAIVLLAAPQRQRDETTVNDLDSILAPACRALFGGTPAELGIALHSSARLRSTYTRRPAMEMAAARRANDVDAARIAAAFAINAVEAGA